MCRLNSTSVFLFFFILTSIPSKELFGQPVSFSISGYVFDEKTSQPIEKATVFFKNYDKHAVSNTQGFFRIEGLQPGIYEMEVSHIGCQIQFLKIDLQCDTLVHIQMNHQDFLLGEILLIDTTLLSQRVFSKTLRSDKILQNGDRNISDMLEFFSGVRTLKTGSLGKPMVRGLYGNRLSVVNNGVAHRGQQWGNDHGLEVDPLMAGEISVVSGSSSLVYQNALGGVVLVDAGQITKEVGLRGKASYFFSSNGLVHSTNLQLQNSYATWAWKLSATLKIGGDRSTPSYYLSNTGSREANFSIQIEKELFSWNTDLYFSTVNSEFGILRGSHVSNETDLKAAFYRDRPFFTQEHFTYQISPPYQQVSHHLWKVSAKRFWEQGGSHSLFFSYAGQADVRNEFDVRRAQRSEIPALSLDQLSHAVALKYESFFSSGMVLKLGTHFELIDNTNDPQTGILPLIPDYVSYEGDFFILAKHKFQNFTAQATFRYDHIFREVLFIFREIPRRVVRYEDAFSNASFGVNIGYHLTKNIKFSGDWMTASRAPSINEKYSYGLHQGVSGIELGSLSLEKEFLTRTGLTLDMGLWEGTFFKFEIYRRLSDGYINLQPQNRVSLTIRGAFPVFQYEQLPVDILGYDVDFLCEIYRGLGLRVMYDYLRGRDRRDNSSLVDIPPNLFTLTLDYKLGKLLGPRFESFRVEAGYKHFFKKNILPHQDFLVAPSAAYIFTAGIFSVIPFSAFRVHASLKVENIFNTKYRNYMNRLRYFAEELGINAHVNLRLDF